MHNYIVAAYISVDSFSEKEACHTKGENGWMKTANNRWPKTTSTFLVCTVIHEKSCVPSYHMKLIPLSRPGLPDVGYSWLLTQLHSCDLWSSRSVNLAWEPTLELQKAKSTISENKKEIPYSIILIFFYIFNAQNT